MSGLYEMEAVAVADSSVAVEVWHRRVPSYVLMTVIAGARAGKLQGCRHACAVQVPRYRVCRTIRRVG